MKKRCCWLDTKNKLYIDYHDKEWGRPVHCDIKHFENITLEGAQAGLSWETVLNKRQRYRKVFSGFDPLKVSKFSKEKINKILEDPGVVRNKLKINSTVKNAKAFLNIQKEFNSFDKYIWQFVDNKVIYNKFKKISDYPSKTDLSIKISKDLKKRGFTFVGPTIIYAYMQGSGLVQDHSTNCYLFNKKIKDLSK